MKSPEGISAARVKDFYIRRRNKFF